MSSVLLVYAPSGDLDNRAYSPKENVAQEKLNYVVTEYSSKADRTDVELNSKRTSYS